MANERIHMNTQGGSRLRQATAVKGKTEAGSQPRTLWKVVSRIHIDLYQMSFRLEQLSLRLLA